MGIERLFSILEAKQAAMVRANECQVYVAAIGDVDTTKRLSLLSKLWKKEIKAETHYTESDRPKKQIDHVIKN